MNVLALRTLGASVALVGLVACVIPTNAINAQKYFNEGFEHLDQGRHYQAADCFHRAAVNADLGHLDFELLALARTMFARSLAMVGEFDRAEPIARGALEMLYEEGYDEPWIPAHGELLLGEIARDNGRPADALTHFRKFHELVLAPGVFGERLQPDGAMYFLGEYRHLAELQGAVGGGARAEASIRALQAEHGEVTAATDWPGFTPDEVARRVAEDQSAEGSRRNVLGD